MAHFFVSCDGGGDASKARCVGCDRALHLLGIAFARVDGAFDLGSLADEFSQTSPMSVFLEDGEYARYRNVMEDAAFPVSEIVASLPLAEHFSTSLKLDDAFVIHYDAAEHQDTTVKRHTDPSDVTVNICLDSNDVVGSKIVFYGSRQLESPAPECLARSTRCECSEGRREDFFSVEPRQGFAMLHYGDHPHETTKLDRGRRTNLVMTFVAASSATAEKDELCANKT